MSAREPTSFAHSAPPPSSLPTELIEPPQTASVSFAPLRWWYRLTTPPDPPSNASLRRRELARRAKLTSTILLFIIFIIVGLAIPVSLITANSQLFVALLGLLALVCTALALTRMGKITPAGIIAVGAVNIALFFALLTWPGGLNANTLPIFDIFIEPELIAVSLLPAWSVFVVAALDGIFCWAAITFMPHTSDLAQILASNKYEVMARPIALLTIVAVVTYLWVRSATQAIARADRATVIAALEHNLAEQAQVAARQKNQLEHSIQQIIDTLIRVANGDFNARVPLTSENILWQVAGALNNLLARLSRLHQEVQELYYTHKAAAYMAKALRERPGTPIPWQQTGTCIDEIALAYNFQTQIFQQNPSRLTRNPPSQMPHQAE